MPSLPPTDPATEIPVFLAGTDHFSQSHGPYLTAHVRSNRGSVSSAESNHSALQLHHSEPSVFSLHPQPLPLTNFVPTSSSASASGYLGDDGSSNVNQAPSSTDQESTRHFACPYTKFDPNRYSALNTRELNYRGCGYCVLTDISRLKQHLYRVHQRPTYYCAVCYVVFKDHEKRDRHIALRSCKAKPCPFDEKMTSQQHNQIKKKNRGMSPGDCWSEIYRTLFPDTPVPVSPYADHTITTMLASLEQFMAYVQERAPPLFRQRLCNNQFIHESMHSQILRSFEQSLSSILQELKRDYEQLPLTDLTIPPSMGSVVPSYEDDEPLQRPSRKRKATDSSLQVPTGFQYAVDAQSLGSYGDVSAPNSFRSTPALADDEAEFYGRQPRTSPAGRFVTSHTEHREVMQQVLPDQLIRVGSSGPQWPQTLQAPTESNPFYQHDGHQQQQQQSQPQQLSSSPSIIFPDPGEWRTQTNLMGVVNLTAATTQPGYPANPAPDWLERGHRTW